MVSLIRGSRRKSQGSQSTSPEAQPGSKSATYVELEELNAGMIQELYPVSQTAK